MAERVARIPAIDDQTKINLSLGLSVSILLSLVLGGIGLGRYVAGMELMTDELKVNTEAITTNTAANTDSIRALGKLVDRFQFQQEHTQRQLDQMADFREADESRLRRVEDALLVISTKDGMGKGG